MPITEADIQRMKDRVNGIQFKVRITIPALFSDAIPLKEGMQLYIKKIDGERLILVPIEQNTE